MSRKLRALFQIAQYQKKPLFLPYICLGYPDYASSLETAKAALRAGADALELGVPFSDPIADGPTLQRATHLSLMKGTKLADVFKMVRDLRKAGFRQPLLVMSYLNLVESWGRDKFIDELAAAGGDGAILPDLPLEEVPALSASMGRKNLSLIPFVSPTSSKERVQKADAVDAPFLYYVSVTGVTGARKTLAPGLLKALQGLKRRLKTPMVVGFGISTPAQAGQVGRVASGVIIASALVQLISKTKRPAIGRAVEGFCRKVIKTLNAK